MSGSAGGFVPGGAGHDALGGASGNDTIDGEAGNDTLGGLGGNDSILGGNDHDLIDGGSGADTSFGGTGNDTIQDPSGNNLVFGEAGTDSLRGGSNADTLDGGSDGDTLTGGGGSDSLFGGLGIDLLDGGSGNDTISGGIENGDSISYASSENPVTISISAEGGSGGTNIATALSAFGEQDQLREFEVIGGSSLNDVISINSAATLFFSLYVAGGAGNDTLVHNANSGAFVDYLRSDITSGVVVDLASGTAQDGAGGIDYISGFRNVRGSDLTDTLYGNAEGNRFRAGLGNDYFDGREGLDIADYLHARSSISVNLTTGTGYKTVGGIDNLVSIEEIRGGSFNDTILGSTADERLRGNGGNNYLMGGAGNDILDYATATRGVSVNLEIGRASNGLGGQDTLAEFEGISGSDYADTLVGGAASDLITGGNGNDWIDFAGGSDSVTYAAGTGNDTLIGGAGADTLYLSAGNWASGNDGIWTTYSQSGTRLYVQGFESVIGAFTPGGASLLGDSGANSLNGGNGDDTLSGLDGDDQLFGGNGADSLIGGNGNDWLFTELNAGNATLLGGSGDDLINAGGGNDILDGGDGADYLFGSPGNDSIFGGAGNDYLEGDSGQDSYRGGGGADVFYLTYFDYLNPSDIGSSVSTPDQVLDFNRAEGDKLILIGSDDAYPSPSYYYTIPEYVAYPLRWMGALSFPIGSLSSGITLPGGAVQLYVPVYWIPQFGGDGWVAMDLNRNGTLDATDFAVFVDTADNQPLTAADFPDEGFDFQIATSGDDSVLGIGAQDLLNGLAGNDTLDGAGGDDVLWGWDGNDLLLGGIGNDTLIGDEGNDTILGGTGGDYIEGWGAASMDGGQGNDTIWGWWSAETIIGGAGDDSIDFGGGGNDSYNYVAGTGNDTVIGGDGFDTLNLSAGPWTQGNDDIWTTYSQGGARLYVRGFESVIETATNSADQSLMGDGGNNSLFGGNGNDTLSGLSGADTLDGGADNDSLLGGDDNDSLLGGAGNDILDGGAGTNTLAGGAGDDTYYASGPVNLFEGSNAGNDILITNIGVTSLPSNIEDILLQGSASLIGTGNLLNNQITGNAGNNSLYGGEGDDSLFGLAGTDYLDGGNGHDLLDGGIGDDTFLGGAGDDTLLGGSGRDRFDGNPGNNLINGGGGGDDYVSYSNGAQGSFGVSVNLVTGIASNTYGGADTLIAIRDINGSAQSDTLIGSDQLSGQVGLSGYPSNGVTFWASGGSDQIDGVLPVSFNYYFGSFANFIATFTDHLNASVIKSTFGTDTLTNITYIYGTSAGEVFNGSPSHAPSDTYFVPINFRGEGGDDTINGFGQTINRADYSSATGSTFIDLEAGFAIDGRGGTDMLFNVRRVRASHFNDTLLGSSGDDVFDSRTLGSHFIDGRAGNNRYQFSDHNGSSPTRDILIDLGTTSAEGGGYVGYALKPGGINDTLVRFNSARSQDGNDTLYGTPGDDTLQALAGDNLLDGRGGQNTLEYGIGWHGSVPTHGVVVNLDTGRATNPWDGVDTISNFQAVIGTPFADSITGSMAAETLTGGAGNDTLIGGGGADTLSGGAGDDVILMGTTTLADLYALFGT